MAALIAAPATATPDEALVTVDTRFSAEVQLLPVIPAAAGCQKRSCAEASVVASWILGSGADYDMCPSDTRGARTIVTTSAPS